MPLPYLFPPIAQSRSLRLRRSGFTMFELLVTIAIVGAVFVLLLPAVSRAQDDAQDDVCRNNQRQLGVAFGSYLADWDDIYPYIRQTDTDSSNERYPHLANTETARSWNRAVLSYLGDYEQPSRRDANRVVAEALWCPQNPYSPFGGTNNDLIPTAYAMNAEGFPNNWVPPSNDVNKPVAARRADSLVQPAETLLLGEVANGPANEVPTERGMQPVRLSSRNFQANEEGLRYPHEWYTDTVARLARVSHDLAWNGLRADGHVERDTKRQLTIERTGYHGPKAANAAPSHRLYWVGDGGQ